MYASNRVLHTYELLEKILTMVDFKTLLLAQRVDHIWLEIITDSARLQKKLFLL